MMLESVFRLILETTFYGSIIGIIVLVFKIFLAKYLSAKWQYLIWVVLILKLIIPFGPESNISIFNTVKPTAITIQENIAETLTLTAPETPAPIIDVAEKPPEPKKTVNLSETAAYIWLIGTVTLFIWLISTNLLLRYQLHKKSALPSDRVICILESCRKRLGIDKKIEIFSQDIISAPSLFGIIKPKILITPSLESMSDKQIEYTLLHELSHYKRKDVFANYLLLILQSIHWFNPVIHYFFNKIRRDMEIATDEQTMLYIENTEYKAYGLALISTLEGFRKNIFAPKLLGMVGGAKDLEKRIRIISKFKKPKFVRSITSVLIIGMMSVFCLTNAETIDILPTQEHKDSIAANTVSIKAPRPDNTEIIEENTVSKEALPSPVPAPQKTENNSTQKPAPPARSPVDAEETEAANESYNTVNVAYDESIAPLTLDEVIGISGNKPIAAGTADLNHFCKLADYNFDTNEIYKFTVYPDVSGNIALYFDTEFPTVVANIRISESGIPESETMCMLPTDRQKIYYFYGLNPDKKYDIEISGYCPGSYNICGKILIY